MRSGHDHHQSAFSNLQEESSDSTDTSETGTNLGDGGGSASVDSWGHGGRWAVGGPDSGAAGSRGHWGAGGPGGPGGAGDHWLGGGGG
jgi:hypothetical protein